MGTVDVGIQCGGFVVERVGNKTLRRQPIIPGLSGDLYGTLLDSAGGDWLTD